MLRCALAREATSQKIPHLEVPSFPGRYRARKYRRVPRHDTATACKRRGVRHQGCVAAMSRGNICYWLARGNMRDQAAYRVCAPVVPAWLRPTAGDPHFWRIGVFFEGRCTTLGSTILTSPALGVTPVVRTSTTNSWAYKRAVLCGYDVRGVAWRAAALSLPCPSPC